MLVPTEEVSKLGAGLASLLVWVSCDKRLGNPHAFAVSVCKPIQVLVGVSVLGSQSGRDVNGIDWQVHWCRPGFLQESAHSFSNPS